MSDEAQRLSSCLLWLKTHWHFVLSFRCTVTTCSTAIATLSHLSRLQELTLDLEAGVEDLSELLRFCCLALPALTSLSFRHYSDSRWHLDLSPLIRLIHLNQLKLGRSLHTACRETQLLALRTLKTLEIDTSGWLQYDPISSLTGLQDICLYAH